MSAIVTSPLGGAAPEIGPLGYPLLLRALSHRYDLYTLLGFIQISKSLGG